LTVFRAFVATDIALRADLFGLRAEVERFVA